MIRRAAIFVLACSMSVAATAQETAPVDAPAGPTLSSQRDYSDPAQRELPIVCKPGDIEAQAGKSLGEVFGKDWPAQPVPSAPSAYRPASTIKAGRIIWPRGMEGKRGLVVVAVLVGADGKPLRAEPICSSTVGFDMSARRAAMSASYEAAMVDGQPITSVSVDVIGFKSDRKGSRRPPSATDD